MSGERTRPVFLGPQKMRQISFQSDNSIESYIVSTNTGQTDSRTFAKPIFFWLSGSQNGMGIPKVIFHIKPIPSYIIRMYKYYWK